MNKTTGNTRGTMKKTLEAAIKHWEYIAPLVKYPKNNKEFDVLVVQLDQLITIVKDNEKHYLMGLIDVVSNVISKYEEKHFPVTTATGKNALRFLMEAHHLQQSDLSDIGSQGVVSEILRGKRALNLRQIKLLAKRFHVSPETFID